MARLTRAEQQQRTRSAVITAARREFAEHGFTPAKIDRIAERAELTRGAVYSNFPGKRALYLAVLLDDVLTAPERPGTSGDPATSGDSGDVAVPGVLTALGQLARRWEDRPPLTADLEIVLTTPEHHRIMGSLVKVNALLLALGLESVTPTVAQVDGGREPAREVRRAELVWSWLLGGSLLSAHAPGLGDPFDRISAAEHLGSMTLDDIWAPSYGPYVREAEIIAPVDLPAATATTRNDLISGDAVVTTGGGLDGLVVVLSPEMLSSAEEAVRSADRVTLLVPVSHDGEADRLVHLVLADALSLLRGVFPVSTWKGFRIVLDADGELSGQLSTSAGFGSPGDDSTRDSTGRSQFAVAVVGGQIVARAEGTGAALAAGAVIGSDSELLDQRPDVVDTESVRLD